MENIILSKDVFNGKLDEKRIEQLVSCKNDMQRLCNTLVENANKNGGRDNITVICLHYKGDINEY